MFTITSANNGNNVPSDEGWEATGPFNLNILGGTTIAAEVQIKTSGGTWKKVPSAEGYADIAADYAHPFNAAPGERYRIAVTTATGTWYGELRQKFSGR